MTPLRFMTSRLRRVDDEMMSLMPRSGVIDAAGEVMRAARHQR
jgi:hypothetical protein